MRDPHGNGNVSTVLIWHSGYDIYYNLARYFRWGKWVRGTGDLLYYFL